MSRIFKELRVKKAKHKCMVRGCPNTNNVYSASRTRENGLSILICSECAGNLAAAIEKYNAEYVEPVRVEKPSPFYNANSPLAGRLLTQKTETPEKFICQHCGRECNGKMGLLRHESACKNKV